MTQNYKNLWDEKREKVRDNHQFNPEWGEIIDNIFKERLDNYYLKPIKKLIDSQLGEGEGFSIIALECLLIETFAAFRYGKCYKNGVKSGYYYSNSKELFTEFLKDKDIGIFENIFWTNNPGEPIGDAESFYKDVRCGILHEAQTKGNWTINTKTKRYKYFLNKEGENIQIYRTLLFHELNRYLEDYCKILKEDTEKGVQLRKNLGRKLDYMFDIKDIGNYNW